MFETSQRTIDGNSVSVFNPDSEGRRAVAMKKSGSTIWGLLGVLQ